MRSKGSKITIADGAQGIPIGVIVESDSVNVVKLLEPTLSEISIGTLGHGIP